MTLKRLLWLASKQNLHPCPWELCIDPSQGSPSDYGAALKSQNCLALIDQTILDCRSQMEEYRQTRSALSAVNERLADLGAEPIKVPDHFPTESLGDLILARVEGLRAEGKI